MEGMGDGRTLGLVCCAAEGCSTVLEGVILPAQASGWRVAVTVTPTAADWWRESGDLERVARATGFPVRWRGRLPSEPSPGPDPDCWAVAPATANTVAKLALGIADNLALTKVGEALGAGVPLVVSPRVGPSQARHPAWAGHLAVLRSAGVRLVGAEAADPAIPWSAVLAAVDALVPAPAGAAGAERVDGARSR